MTFTVADILAETGVTLTDEDAVRWPLVERLGYINDAIREIIAAKPNAATATITLTLVAGTLQRLPDTYTTLSRVTRNMTIGHDEPGGPVAGLAIRPIASRDDLDALIPGWQSNASLFAQRVVHVIYDLADPRVFYVAPGNDGTGKVEAVVGLQLADIPVPPSPLLIDSYSAVIPLRDPYRNAIREYVLHRCYAKDAGIPAAANRSVAYLNSFNEKLAAIGSGEAAMAMGAGG